jgi:hypothetical protein
MQQAPGSHEARIRPRRYAGRKVAAAGALTGAGALSGGSAIAIPGVASQRGPPAEAIPPVPLGPCDAAASGVCTALIRLEREDAEILLCGHHGSVHELALIAARWVITRDDRDA